MNKIRLYDGTELNIENGATENCVAVIIGDLSVIDTYVKAFTKENLVYAEIINCNEISANEEVVSVIKDKYLINFDGTQIVGDTNYIVCFHFSNVYSIEDRLAMLEAENMALKESQEIQDEAIVELADIIAE